MPFNSENASVYGKRGGRPGYELEQAQLEKMRKILDKDLAIIERLQDADEINPTDERKLQISQARVSKYLDKLHASKQSLEGNVDSPLVIKIEQEIANKYANRIPNESNTGQPQV